MIENELSEEKKGFFFKNIQGEKKILNFLIFFLDKKILCSLNFMNTGCSDPGVNDLHSIWLQNFWRSCGALVLVLPYLTKQQTQVGQND